MWWTILLGALAVALYLYSSAGTVKISPKAGCSSCPKKDMADY